MYGVVFLHNNTKAEAFVRTLRTAEKYAEFFITYVKIVCFMPPLKYAT